MSEVDSEDVLSGDILSTVGSCWNSKSKDQNRKRRIRWWESARIIRHINRKMCGREVDGLSQGLNEAVRQRFASRLPFEKAIAVGCGTGQKEMALIKHGLVRNFDLFELSSVRIETGQKLAAQMGLQDNVRFRREDAFVAVNEEGCYDVVYWNNSLHHMFDSRAAVRWSHMILKPGGLFLMDDYVGPNYLQTTDKTLSIISLVREALTDKYLENPHAPGTLLPKALGRPNLERLKNMDPSEAADSERILESVLEFFPDAYISHTGGAVYHTALNDALHNIDEQHDAVVLNLLMLIDDLCIELGENQYAMAIGVKESEDATVIAGMSMANKAFKALLDDFIAASGDFDSISNIKAAITADRVALSDAKLFAQELFASSSHLHKALTLIETVLEAYPLDYEAWNDRGVILYTLGRIEEAQESLAQALSLKHDYVEASENLRMTREL